MSEEKIYIRKVGASTWKATCGAHTPIVSVGFCAAFWRYSYRSALGAALVHARDDHGVRI